MAGLDSKTPLPTAITVHQQSRALQIAFSDGAEFRIPHVAVAADRGMTSRRKGSAPATM